MILVGNSLVGQGVVKGVIADESTGETLIGAAVVIKGTTIGTTTDFDGKFEFSVEQNPPFTLVVTFLGYSTKELEVTDFNQKIKIEMGTDQVLISEVEVFGSRISEKTKQAPLTVESMDILAIKEAPSGSFYESLGNLKGVDVTSASMGFKIINTRGFNSTSPVRSLQLIDGVDNQSPGFNFALGNFLGASDLDVKSVDIIAGASSAYYGPGAFNGVVDMHTKDPFLFPGLSASIKMGERDLFEGAVRWAEVIKNKEGEDKFAYKLNFFHMRAYDWEANNYNAVDDAEDGPSNYSGYDAVNIYGDEVTEGGNDYELDVNYPGLTRIYRRGYQENDIADYDTRNTKANVGLYYKLKEDVILSYGFNYGNGTTIYQGDNRMSLKDIQFFQNKIEIKKKDKFFFRAYTTHEDAGNTYDAVLTANIMSDIAKEQPSYYSDYANFYSNRSDILYDLGMPNEDDYSDTFPQFGDFPDPADFQAALLEWRTGIRNDQTAWANANPEAMIAYNDDIRRRTEESAAIGQNAFYQPGTARYDSLLNAVSSELITNGGSKFYDKSALYHAQGEYIWDFDFGKIIAGANGRYYTPKSRGTIFSDSLNYRREQQMVIDPISQDTTFQEVIIEEGYEKITNWEVGAYVGYENKFINDLLTLKVTLRMDKNENFDAIASPAFSLVYQLHEDHILRGGVSSAIRNPTLINQYQYYNTGQAILIGNLNGYDSLATLESFDDARNLTPNFTWNTLDYYDVDPIAPEKVQTFEVGYRGTLAKKVYVDFNYYYSIYRDFIGYNIGMDIPYTPNNPFPSNFTVYRVAANATEKVYTQGASLGINYYFYKSFALTGNYTWNKLVSGNDDPIIPAYNTPEHKFNIGINARDLSTDFGFFKLKNWGFGVNYKWIDSYIFEGSPQFTGNVPSYYLLDAAATVNFKKINTSVKVGASNLTDNNVYTVYGGPYVGRMAYFSITYEWMNR